MSCNPLSFPDIWIARFQQSLLCHSQFPFFNDPSEYMTCRCRTTQPADICEWPIGFLNLITPNTRMKQGALHATDFTPRKSMSSANAQQRAPHPDYTYNIFPRGPLYNSIHNSSTPLGINIRRDGLSSILFYQIYAISPTSTFSIIWVQVVSSALAYQLPRQRLSHSLASTICSVHPTFTRLWNRYTVGRVEITKYHSCCPLLKVSGGNYQPWGFYIVGQSGSLKFLLNNEAIN